MQGGMNEGIVIGILMMAGGGVMIFFGQRHLSRIKLTAEFGLQMLREDGKINAVDLAHRVGVSEVDVRGYMTDAQRKGLIPFKADIV